MVLYVSQAMKQAAHEATVLLYSPGIDPILEDPAKGADRVFYFEGVFYLRKGQNRSKYLPAGCSSAQLNDLSTIVPIASR
jgi:hypothetical protein